jgi:hypothetical protein
MTVMTYKTIKIDSMAEKRMYIVIMVISSAGDSEGPVWFLLPLSSNIVHSRNLKTN